jgi:iron complex outermembrane receptor protein
LTVQVFEGPPPVTRELNGSPTEKEGVELGLDTILWHEDGQTAPFKAKHRLLLRQAFTINAFNYKNDPNYGKNQLPGVPRQFYQGEISYEHPSGFYGGPSIQYAGSNYVDYANTFKVHAYTIYGFKIGYDAPKGNWQAYLDFRNLTDKGHTVSVSPVFDTRQDPHADPGTPQGRPNDLRQLSPGDGFGVFGGLTLKF